MSEQHRPDKPAAAGGTGTNPSERRSRRRAMISAPVLVRKVDADSPDTGDVSTTIDVSRNGILFVAAKPSYRKDMQVAVTFPYSKSLDYLQTERLGRVTRVQTSSDGSHAVAISFGPLVVTEIAETASQSSGISHLEPDVKPPHGKPLILIVDADQKIRQTLKSYLLGQGYEIIAVQSAAEGRDVLKMFKPALLIAEIEGGDLPGYTLCAHVKSVPSLRHIPVVLTTRAAYPTDYSNAHSLGAVVCMAKPFQVERIGHVVRLLVPAVSRSRQPVAGRSAKH